MTLEVSVVIPTRNRWDLLARTLRSALGQRGVDHEVIVVDDASDDATPARLAEVAEARLRAIRLPRRSGPAAARNAGIKVARAPWVAFLDHDDLWSPHKLRLQLDAAARADASFVYVGAVRVDEELHILGVDGRMVDASQLPSELLATNPIPGGCSGPIVRAELARGIGGFDESLRYLEDWDFWIRATEAGRSVACPEVLVAYVIRRDNMVVSEQWDIQREFGYLQQKHAVASRRAGRYLNGLEFYRWIALVHWRTGHRWRAATLLLGGVPRHLRAANLALLADQVGRYLKHRLAPEGSMVEPDWLELYR